MTDQPTLNWYEAEAPGYAKAMQQGGLSDLSASFLDPFLARLAPGSLVLELGCGGGRDTMALLAAGMQVDATDGAAAMVAEARRLTGHPVRQMRFEQLEAEAAYDAVWAHASLHHQSFAGLGDVLVRVHRALRPGGWFFANYKLGNGEGRDALGRLYSFPPQADLLALYDQQVWRERHLHSYRAGGADGVERDWLAITVRKPAG